MIAYDIDLCKMPLTGSSIRLSVPIEARRIKRAVGMQKSSVDQDYKIFDIFEQLDGAPIWRGHATSLLQAHSILLELTRKTANECFVIYLPTKEVVERVKARTEDGKQPMVA